MPDYFKSNIKRAADKRASEDLTNKIHNECSDFFPGIDSFEITFTLQVKEAVNHIRYLQEGKIYFAGNTEGRAGEASKAASDSTTRC